MAGTARAPDGTPAQGAGPEAIRVQPLRVARALGRPHALPTTFVGIQNENEFYSHHYLSELFGNDLQATTARWRDSAAGSANGRRTPDQTLRALARPYLQFRQQFRRERRHQARVQLQREWFRQLLSALGYDFRPANHLLDDASPRSGRKGNDEVPVLNGTDIRPRCSPASRARRL